jgi:heterodisulfide reductase subunit A-like polyferredoxin/coenzyme F420-reducing hydrogenase delta subunit
MRTESAVEQVKAGKIGSVLVVGGGVGGVQASLDLADAGFKVYLVEEKPSIGGLMAQLDKTFPTNDCSMCILAPKLVDAGSHPNIEILASSDVLALDGKPGRMTATVMRRARFIDEDVCTGCGECATVCPVDLPSIFNAGIGSRKATDRLYPQAVPSTYSIAKKERAPCSAGCPIDTSIQAYVALIAKGEVQKAAEVIRRENPLPAICGRVCFHPCESSCNRAEIDEPLNIRALKRYAIENCANPEAPTDIAPSGKRVAVVGSGPAGLAAAHALAYEGHAVTVIEALPVMGGMVAVGIPRYRLPEDVLARDLDFIRALGVEFRPSTKVGVDVPPEDLRADFDALFIATGAHVSKKLDVPGEDAAGVCSGTEYLRAHALAEPDAPRGNRVLVVGGGNTSIDAARTAVRLGAEKVTILYRRTRNEMPADPEEIDGALAEGVEIVYLVSPVQVLSEGGCVAGAEFLRNELGPPDNSGRRSPVPIEGSQFTVEADLILTAISESPDSTLAKALGLKTTRWGSIETDELTGATSLEGVFAGGDVVLGPSSVIQAIAQGKRAAKAIDNHLKGNSLNQGISAGKDRVNPLSEGDLAKLKKDTPHKHRAHPSEPSAEERQHGFGEVEHILTEEEARAEASRCLSCSDCCECFRCVEVCKAHAIDHLMQDRVVKIEVGATILALGIETFHAELKGEYGYGVYPNVVSALQFERILCASGPYGGHVVRPSDHTEPRRIAFLQCVGSRDMRCDKEYCSSVCCTYATKEAILAREHCPGSEITIFGMDFRTHGKDFEKFMLRAQRESGVRYIRGRVPAVDQDPGTGNLWLTYEDDDGRRKEEEFDLVVLSVGLEVPQRVRDLAGRLGVQMNEYGFAAMRPDRPLETTRPGVFVCGAFEAPKDIPETVMQASAAAAAAAGVLAEARGMQVTLKEYPPEKDVRYDEPRVGVFVCSCGSNIAGTVDVASVTEFAKTLPNVVLAQNMLYTCSQDALNQMKAVVTEHNLNRVVVASCSPRTHEKLFQENIREEGLNRFLFEMANIRDHCSWVHRDNPAAATDKAKDLVAGAVAKVRLSEPLETQTFEVCKSSLVIGGGVAGMTAAISLADQGFDVTLVEKQARLGGMSRRISHTIDGMDVAAYIESLADAVRQRVRIRLWVSSEVTGVSGSVGSFHARIVTPAGERHEDHGAIVVATGGREYAATEFGYGRHPAVMTQMEFEERLADGRDLDRLSTVAMIQCVGSRTEENPNCSRICCAEAVKNAIAFKKARPDATVYVLYRDLRTYGLMERFYREAREMGVLFIRYKAEKPPQVDVNGVLKIRFDEPILHREIEKELDALVLSVGVRPGADNTTIAPLLKVPLTQDGYFFEAHVKLRPVDFSTDGVFVCGMAHGPKLISEAAVQGLAAASRAATILSQDRMESLATVCEVSPRVCSGCHLCNTLCAYDAISFDDKLGVSVINAAACKGCGTCSANCPSQAITARNFREDQLFEQITAISNRHDGAVEADAGGVFEPKVLAFLCNWCSYGGADLAGISRIQYPPNLRVIRVMCSGRVTPLDVFKALEEGFDGVWISGCHPGDCHYTEGNYHARRRWMAFRELLKSTGVDERRITFSWVSASESQKFADTAREVVEQIRALGPNREFSAISPVTQEAPSYL